MRIVLVGYRAAGKSTLGQLLSKTLNMPFLDIDRSIEQRIGKQTLIEFYREVGEEGFRPMETDLVVEMCSANSATIAFGAGSLTLERNQQAATENSLVVYLQVPVADLWKRIQFDPSGNHTRPNLARGGRSNARPARAHLFGLRRLSGFRHQKTQSTAAGPC